MQLSDLDPTSSSNDWDRKWVDIFDHYQSDLRHAYYIHAMLNEDEHRILEIAAGSFRDMTELRRRGFDCEGMDFSTESVARARQHFPEFSRAIHHASAFEMPFADQAFDVSYHNGFWVLFSDEQIRHLAAEQARISRSRIIATVHNSHNKQFVDYFEKKKANDPLYDIRFFNIDQMMELMHETCRSVEIIPVGKGKQHHEDLLIRNGVTDPATLRACLGDSGLQYLNSSERLLCIGTLRK